MGLVVSDAVPSISAQLQPMSSSYCHDFPSVAVSTLATSQYGIRARTLNQYMRIQLLKDLIRSEMLDKVVQGNVCVQRQYASSNPIGTVHIFAAAR